MPRKYFDQKLADLNRSMKEMGAVVDRRIGETMEALKNLDKDLAAEVVGGDREINQVEHEIESVCMNLLALQQPIATDLRVIASCLKSSLTWSGWRTSAPISAILYRREKFPPSPAL